MIQNPENPYVQERFVCDCGGHTLSLMYFPREKNEKFVEDPKGLEGIFQRESMYIHSEIRDYKWSFWEKVKHCWKIMRGYKVFLEEVELVGEDVDRFLKFQKDVFEVRKLEQEKKI